MPARRITTTTSTSMPSMITNTAAGITTVLARSRWRALPWVTRPKTPGHTCTPMARDMIVDLPAQSADAEDGAVIREAGSPAAPAPRRVLVVEDESDLARVVKRHVESLGCQVQVAASGEEALVL